LPTIISTVCLLACVVGLSKAERLPLRAYTTQDGLGSDLVRRVLQDSRGYIWFGTRAGISRFDGYTFVNYRIPVKDGSASVRDLLETRTGVYWIATAGNGLCRFNPSAAPSTARFSCYATGKTEDSNYVMRLYEDHRGRLWVGTGDGLFVAEGSPEKPVFRQVSVPCEHQLEIRSLLEDKSGVMWIGTSAWGL
jgi:ligand-binding sensor domain-containing protein